MTKGQDKTGRSRADEDVEGEPGEGGEELVPEALLRPRQGTTGRTPARPPGAGARWRRPAARSPRWPQTKK